jgi:hypothetical protein
MTTVLENYSFLITIGMSLLFLLLGTIVGFAMMKKSEKQKGSHFINNNIKPFASASELKSYLNSLEFEKRLTAESLTRVFEAMNAGKISSLECDRLILQYEEKLKFFEREISELRSTSDLNELQAVRNDLNYFLQIKMKQVDEKLSQILQRNSHIESNPGLLDSFATRDNRGKFNKIRDRSTLLSHRTKTFINQEKRIQDTQNEIMTKLERLGGRYADRDQAGIKTFYNTNKNALAGFDIG